MGIKRSSIYLAGGISGLSWEESIGWRRQVMDILKPEGIDCFSPLRAKSYLRPEKEIANTYESHVLSSQRGIFARDYFDCINCDMVFVNFLGAKTLSGGTFMEIAWAYDNKKPIVCVIEDEGNPNDHAMAMEACRFRVNSIEEGIWVAKTVLLPVSHDAEHFNDAEVEGFRDEQESEDG